MKYINKFRPLRDYTALEEFEGTGVGLSIRAKSDSRMKECLG